MPLIYHPAHPARAIPPVAVTGGGGGAESAVDAADQPGEEPREDGLAQRVARVLGLRGGQMTGDKEEWEEGGMERTERERWFCTAACELDE